MRLLHHQKIFPDPLHSNWLLETSRRMRRRINRPLKVNGILPAWEWNKAEYGNARAVTVSERRMNPVAIDRHKMWKRRVGSRHEAWFTDLRKSVALAKSVCYFFNRQKYPIYAGIKLRRIKSRKCGLLSFDLIVNVLWNEFHVETNFKNCYCYAQILRT